MRHKKLLRTVATFLSVLMISQLPAQALAQANTPTLSEDNVNQTAETTAAETYAYDEDNSFDSSDIINEITEKRTESTKYFHVGNGKYIATQYDLPVHYQDDDGNWQQYDNSLEDADSNTYASEEEQAYQNKKSNHEIKLAKKAKKNNMISIKNKDRSISWGYDGISKSRIEISGYQVSSDPTVLSHIQQEAWYRDVYKNVDLQVIVTSTGVKENIVLKNKDVQKEFLIHYKANKLTPVQQDEKTILLNDSDGNTVYTLSAPIMTDALGKSSTDITLQLNEENGNQFSVKLVADKQWIEDAERQFPVTIDPFVETKQTYDNIHSASLLSYSTEDYPYGYLNVGRDSAFYGRMVSVYKSGQLPQLGAGDMVVGAQIAMSHRVYSGTENTQVNVSKIKSDWKESDFVNGTPVPAGYNRRPSTDSKIEDFNIANNSTVTKWMYWDITSVVKDWYNGDPNYGLMFWSNTPDTYAYATFVRADKNGNYPGAAYPVISVNYVNNNGLEDYWTYHNFGVSKNGAAYVNDYTGNLVVAENIFSTTGSRMPMNISLYYNLRNYDKKFKYGTTPGLGFMFNFQQRIDEVKDSKLKDKGYKYIYTDGDGTEHYFRKKDGSTTKDPEWVDEEGLSLTIKEKGDSGEGLYLHAKDGSVMHFYTPNSSGNLFLAKDIYGNILRFYSTEPCGASYGRAITSVRDGAGRTATIQYEVAGGMMRVKSIKDNENRIYSFTYHASDATLLEKVVYPDGTKTTYNYSGKRMVKIFDSMGQQTSFEFAGTDSIKKTQIKSVTSSVVNDDASLSTAEKLTFSYNKNNTTTITNMDGKSQEYQFDNAGRTTSVRYPDGSISNASYNADTGGSKTQSSAPNSVVNNNKVISENASEKYVKNYIINPGGERNEGFYMSHGDDSTLVSQSYDSSTAYLGNRSIKVCHDRPGMTNSSYAQQLLTTDFSNSDLTLSAYIKTSDVKAVDSAGKGGAGLLMYYYDASGTYIGGTIDSVYLSGTNDWNRVSLTGHAPAGTAEVRIYCTLRNATGTAWFDCIQLEKSSVANACNMVENSDFRKTGIWTTANFVSGDNFTGNGQVTVKGSATTNKFIYQNIPVNKANMSFNVFGTMQGAQAADKSGRLCGMEIAVRYTDGTTEYHTKKFNSATAAAQSVSYAVKPKKAGVKVNNIGVYYIFRNQANTTNLKNVMVTFDEIGTSYAYDSKGNLISSADNASRNQAYAFNDANELTKYTDNKNQTYNYIYDTTNKHKLNAVRSNQLGNGYKYTYDAYGNVTNVTMGTVDTSGNVDASKEKMTSSTTYDSAGNYAVSQTDTRGNTTTSDINPANGLLNSVTSPITLYNEDSTVTTSYTYNNTTRLLEQVRSDANANTVDYSYDSKWRLQKIDFGGIHYSFAYDKYGNTRNTKVGSRVLSSNSYSDARKGLIGTSTYGNGDTVGFTYDTFDRLLTKKYGADTVLRNTYNNRGQLARVQDSLAGYTTDYDFDLSGRLVNSHQSGSRDARFYYTYDSQNLLRTYGVNIGGTHIDADYTYGKDNLLTISYQGMMRYDYVYDNLNRVTSESIRMFNGNNLKNTYAYITGTGLVSKKQFYKNDVLQETLEYTYDKAGNIHTIKKNGVLQVTYHYDELNQLVQEIYGSKAALYNYDANGNMTSKMFADATGEGPAIQKVNYLYEDADWPDLLTSYNGEAITYDEIGNPLTYRDGMRMTWQNGRKLATLQKGEDVISYQYEANGLRIGKTVNGVQTKYHYDDAGRLVMADKAGDQMWFFYNPDGTAMSMKYRGLRYYYIKNLQGDVTGITDQNGNVIVNYEYDAWGKLLGITGSDGTALTEGSLADTISKLNPFRYRSYVYDDETGLYYLKSRYYDPQTGRFVNADGTIGAEQNLSTLNLFVYCSNNPVNRVDYTGRSSIAIYNEMMRLKKLALTEGTMIIKRYCELQIQYQQALEQERIIGGYVYDLGKGWKARKDQFHGNFPPPGFEYHMHVYNDNENYAQNWNGKPHDGLEGEPPSRVKEKLKEKTGWDWDHNKSLAECAEGRPSAEMNIPLEMIITIGIAIGVYFLSGGTIQLPALQTA